MYQVTYYFVPLNFTGTYIKITQKIQNFNSIGRIYKINYAKSQEFYATVQSWL